jgi:putative ABC transport system permease protein
MNIDGLLQDIRYGIRQLVRAPVFTAVASVSVAVAVIVAASAFSLWNAVFLKPLPVSQPDEIYHVYTSDYDGRAEPWGASSYRDYEDFASSGAFDGLAASAFRTVFVKVGDGEPRQQFIDFVSDNYFSLLGVKLTQGMGFRPGNSPEIIVTHPYWQRELGGGDVIGQTIDVNSTPLTIVGVAPSSFRGISVGPPVVGWARAGVLPEVARDRDALTTRSSRGFVVFGRLKDAQGVTRATSQLNATAARIAVDDPDAWLDANKEVRLVSVLPQGESLLPPGLQGKLALPITGAVLLVILVVVLACTNVAALVIGRAVGRESEISVRLTLGASRARLVRQLLTESVLLALLGGTISFVGLIWIVKYLERVPFADVLDVSPDWRIAAAVIAISMLCALVFGLAPAIQSLRVDLRSGIGGGATVRRNRMRGVLISLQLAVASVLILVAVSATRGITNYMRIDPGVDLDGLVAVHIDGHPFGDDSIGLRTYISGIGVLIATLPAVRSSASTGLLPLGSSTTTTDLTLPDGTKDGAEMNTVGADYFGMMELTPVRGRLFDESDRGSAPVAVVNEAFIEEFGDLLGRHIDISAGSGLEIVGVVPEVQYHEPRHAFYPMVYVLEDQFPRHSDRHQFVMRVAAGSEAATIRELQSRISTRFPQAAKPAIATVRALSENQTLPHRIAGRVALGIGGVELAMASIGLYGLLLFAAVARRREIGIRLALGASGREASWAVMRDGLKYAAAGIALGMLVGVPAVMISALAFPGARAADPVPFVAALMAVVFTGVLAAYLPARKAGDVQPASALRYD